MAVEKEKNVVKKKRKKPKKIKPKTLVIVESPSKAKTIGKYLGPNYVISSSVGHVIDLPKSRLAIDIENDFTPEYITIRGKAKVLNELKSFAKKVDLVLLATDPDREGEAIAWHLEKALFSRNENIKRIEFNEVTEEAVKEAITKPRDINMGLVNAQQARRILDRIVGYNISPILWLKVKRGLSAGRVQSVALKVISDREEEVDAFDPVEYWTIDADLKYKNKKFNGSLNQVDGEKISIANKEEVDNILNEIENKDFIVSTLKVSERKRKSPAPYSTSKLQQDAANRLGFTSKKIMIVAQQLYEGINITGEGLVGLITYMRTDSLRISDSAMESLRNYIVDNFDKEYLPENPNLYKNKKGAQDAHEAIRPTSVIRTPDSIKGDLTKDQFRLYDLIWRRFVSSQMTPEVSEISTANLTVGKYNFKTGGSKVLFKGFTVVDKQSKTDKTNFPSFSVGDKVELSSLNPEQHYTSPPPRFNEASLVRFLEESGIGRPSTYSSIIETLIRRYYISRSGRQLQPTVLGKLVNKLVKENFSSLVSIDFTANMEEKLDLVEEEKFNWVDMLKEFWTPFKESVDAAEENIEDMKGILDEETDIECEKCGKMMVKKLGKFGYFLACPGFPECRNAKSLPLGKCPVCDDGDIVKRASKTGRGNFYGCNNYPECEFMTRETPSDKECPKCKSLLFKKKLKGVGEQLICLREDCGFTLNLLDENSSDNNK